MELLPDGSGLKDYQKILDDVAEGRTFFVCGKHQYTPGPNTVPTSGCADCWRAFYWTIFAQLGPEAGEEWLDGLEAAVHHSVEAVEKGTWDFEPARMDFQVEKDALPEEGDEIKLIVEPN